MRLLVLILTILCIVGCSSENPIEDGGVSMSSALSVYRDTTIQSISSGVTTKVELNGVDYDLLGEFDAVTDFEFTATEAGKYLVCGQVSFLVDSDGDQLIVYLRKNGTGFATGLIEASGVEQTHVHTSKVIDVSIGDTITMHTANSNNNDAVMYSIMNTFLTITRLL